MKKKVRDFLVILFGHLLHLIHKVGQPQSTEHVGKKGSETA